MAEHVQAALDQMVAPLRDLMDRNIFSEAEIKAIVARRRESEYLLRRLTARKVDFLRYIDAEQLLERLRKLRTIQRRRDHRKHQPVDEDGNVKKEKQHIGDVHIVQHIHLLFVRAIRKFRSDLSIHLLHADFCKDQKSFNRLGRVYAEALQVFPRKTGLWIEAASHEFFGPTRSIRNARILLQRGLRLNNKSEDLWVEYFSLELHYAQTLKGRRQILQGETHEPDVNEYKIPGIVYNNAIKAIPNSVPFRLRFLDTCQRFPNTESLMESIQIPLKDDFASTPEAWIARAMYEAQKRSKENDLTKMEQTAAESTESISSDGEDEKDSQASEEEEERPSKRARRKDPVVMVLEEAIERNQSDAMLLQAFRFVEMYRDNLEEQGKTDQKDQAEKFIDQLLENYSSNHSSPDLALELAEYYSELDLDDKAVQVLETYCTTRKNAPSSLWIRWAGMSPKSAKSILEKSLNSIPMSESGHMDVLLQLFGCLMFEKAANNKLLDLFERILILAPSAATLVVEDVGDFPFGIESVAHAFVKYLEHANETLGLQSARKVYSKVLFHSTVQVNESNAGYVKAFVDKCVQIETKDKVRLRRIYDKAVELFEDTSLESIYREQRSDKVI